MDLAQLKFVVDTSELKTAVTEIEKLGTAVNKLNKPMQEAAKASGDLNKEQQNTANTTRQTESVVKKQVSVLERQQMILEFMTQGFSKGQSSQLAYAKASGAITDELEKLGAVLQKQRTLMGTDPFDKSLGAMQALKNEYTVIREVQRLYNAELGLSKSQMEDLAREKLRLIEKSKLEGDSLSKLKKELREVESIYVRNANAENTITDSMRQRQKATLDTAKAQDYIAREFDRVNRLTSDTGNITSATNNKLIQMEKALRLSGMSADEQAVKLNNYRKSLESIQKASGNKQVDYLSRALGPQITDVFVGLATGQSPLMVLLQQGGQLRDQFALAGVAGAQMGEMLVQASKAMITSVKDVGVAVGGLLLNAVVGTGKAITNALVAPLQVGAAMLYDVATGADTAASAIAGLKTALNALSKVGLMLVVTAAVAAVVALRDLIKEQDAVSKSANLFGGSLGLTTNSIYAQATAFDQSGINVSKYINAINAAAKAGVQSSSDLKLVTDAIVAMNKVGIDAEDTAKRFADLGEKPTKALREFAKQTGLISPAIMETVRLLEEQGKKSEAVADATRAMSTAMIEASKQIQSEQGYIVRAFDTITKAASDLWQMILNFGRPLALEDQIIEAEAKLTTALRGDMRSKARQEAVKVLQLEIATLRERLEQEKQVEKAKRESSQFAVAGEEADKARKKAKDDADKAAKKSQDEYNRLLEQARQYYSNTVSAVENLTKSEQNLNKVRESDEYKRRTANQKKEIDQWYELSKVNEEQKKAEEERLKLAKQAEQDRKSQLATINSILGAADKMGTDYYNKVRILDEAWADGNISLEQHTNLLNKLFNTTTSARSLQTLSADVTKTVSDINAQIASIQSEYGMDFRTEDQKSRMKADSKFTMDLKKTEAEYKKRLADIDKNNNAADAVKAIELAQKERDAKVKLAQEVYDRETFVLSEGFRRQQAYANAFENLFNGMADAIVNFAKTGKLNFGDLIDSMISDLIRFELRAQMMQMYQGFGGSAGIISSIGGMLGIGSTSAFGQNVAAGGSYAGFAKGGAFTNKVVDSPTMFKFAKGTGLMGEAGPEAIMPLTRDSSGRLGVQASGSGSNVSVQIINNSNSQAVANETVDSKGNRKIEVLIGDMAAGEISRSGSASQKSIRSTFGITPQLIRR